MSERTWIVFLLLALLVLPASVYGNASRAPESGVSATFGMTMSRASAKTSLLGLSGSLSPWSAQLLPKSPAFLMQHGTVAGSTLPAAISVLAVHVPEHWSLPVSLLFFLLTIAIFGVLTRAGLLRVVL